MSRVSVSTVLFDGYPLDQALAMIAAAGVQHVEPAFISGYTDFTEASFSENEARTLRDRCKATGLSIGTVSAHMDLGQDGVDVIAMVQRRLRFVAACGGTVLVTNAGLARDTDLIERRIATVLPLCEEIGVTLALENPGHGEGALFHDVTSGTAFARRFDTPALRLNYDLGNIYSYSGGNLQPAADLKGADTAMIGHLHLKDIISIGDDWRFCALGQGEVDLTAAMEMLPGWLPLSLELPLRLTRPHRKAPVREAAPVPLSVLQDALTQSVKALQPL